MTKVAGQVRQTVRSTPSRGAWLSRVRVGAIFVALLSGVVVAGDDKDVFKRVEAGRADVGPSATSMRVMPRSAQTPANFEYVYRIERGKYAGKFARRDGAVTAVFPRSVYSDIDGVIVPSVPPGTTYVIGGIGGSEPGGGTGRGTGDRGLRASTSVPRAAAQPAGAGAVDSRAPSAANGARRPRSTDRDADEAGKGSGTTRDSARTDAPGSKGTTKSAASETGVASIWTDDGLRKSRVLALLESVRTSRR